MGPYSSEAWGRYTVITPAPSFLTPKKSGFTIGWGAAIYTKKENVKSSKIIKMMSYLSSDGDLGRRPVAAVLWDGGDVDMVGGEGREVLDGVLRGLVAHQDRDLGDPDRLGDALGVNKLLVRVIRDLVVDWREPANIQC